MTASSESGDDANNALWARRYSGPSRMALMAHMRMGGNLAEDDPKGLKSDRLHEILQQATSSAPFVQDEDLASRVDAIILEKPDSLDAWQWFYRPMAIAAVLAHLDMGGTLDSHDATVGMPAKELVGMFKSVGYRLLPSDEVLTARCEHFLLDLARAADGGE